MKNSLFLLLCTLIFAGCSSTKLVSSWKQPDFESKNYQKVGVVAFAKNLSNRISAENALVADLKSKGINAVSTLDIFPYAGQLGLDSVDQNMIRRKVQENDLDAVITISVLHVDEEQEYVPGDVSYQAAYGYTYHGYYRYTYVRVYEPGYYEVSKTYYIESNFFDVATEKLVWSGKTKTADPYNIEAAADDYAKVVVNDLVEKSVLYDTGK